MEKVCNVTDQDEQYVYNNKIENGCHFIPPFFRDKYTLWNFQAKFTINIPAFKKTELHIYSSVNARCGLWAAVRQEHQNVSKEYLADVR